MKRGDIYYIEINDEGVTGHEMMKSRPGIIVSRDDHNEAAETVQVVYCSAPSTGSAGARLHPQHTQAEHGHVRAHLHGGQVQTGQLRGTPDAPGDAEAGHRHHGGPGHRRRDGTGKSAGGGTPAPTPEQRELERTRCELETIRTMYERLLDRVMGRAG